MNRIIIDCSDTADLSITPPESGLRDWLSNQAKKHHLTVLLAHATDGVIWGHWDGTRLVTAHEAGGIAKHAMTQRISAELRDQTLLEARLFSTSAELHIWRSGGTWQGCLIQATNTGEEPKFTEYIEELYMLWGDWAEAVGGTGFTLLSDGAQGLRHAAPLELKPAKYDVRPLRLKVRHYLAKDEDAARIVASRLVELSEIKQ